MANVRWRVFSLLAWLFIFFNIERLDINGQDTINLASSIYLVALVVSILVMLPFLQQRSAALSFAIGGILTATALITSSSQLIGDFHTYLTIAEFGMVMMTVFLARRVGQALEEFRHAVEVVTFSGQGGRLQKMNEAQEAVQVEVSSSRRTQRPLSLILLQANAMAMDNVMHQLVQEVQRAMLQRYVLGTVARVLSRSLRKTDLIIEDHRPGRLILMAPDTSEIGADAMSKRLIGLMQERLGISANYSIATFPDQALTFEELLNVAEQRLHMPRLDVDGDSDSDTEIVDLADQREHLPPATQTKTVGL